MNDCDALLKQVMDEAAALGIPFSEQVDPHVTLNRRAVARFGCCRRYPDGHFTIELARRVAEGPERSCRETLAHELLHTCCHCQNHGKRWQSYARKMNAAYGYNLARTASNEALGLEAGEPKYLLRCDACGAEFPRHRASPLTEHPERYRCKCGGRLVREK